MTRVLMGTPREALPLDLLQQQSSDELIRSAMAGLVPADQLDAVLAPRDQVAEFIYALSSTAQGREFFEWFMDMTMRLPYRVTGASLEQTALYAAKREGLNLAGELILAAIARGAKSVAARTPGAQS